MTIYSFLINSDFGGWPVMILISKMFSGPAASAILHMLARLHSIPPALSFLVEGTNTMIRLEMVG